MTGSRRDISLLFCLIFALSATADLGWDLPQQAEKYGVPNVDKQPRKGYPGLLFRHFFLHGTDIDVGVEKINGTWRSVWESYQNFREVRDGYRDGRPAFKREVVPFTANEIGRRLAENAGGVKWSDKGVGEVSADGEAYIIMKRLDGQAYAILNDTMIYVVIARHYPALRQELKLAPAKATEGK